MRESNKSARNYRATMMRLGIVGLDVVPHSKDKLRWESKGRRIITGLLPWPELTAEQMLARMQNEMVTYTCTSGRGASCTCYACHGG